MCDREGLVSSLNGGLNKFLLLVLIPNTPLPFDCLAINRRDGSCNAHSFDQISFAREECDESDLLGDLRASMESDELNRNVGEPDGSMPDNRRKRTALIVPKRAFALESIYGNLWMFDAVTKTLHYFNIMASEFGTDPGLRAILQPELALPRKAEGEVPRYLASMNLLACLDILTTAADAIPHCFEAAVVLPTKNKDVRPEDYQSLCRFENLGGGWGYSGHSVEAVRFMCDTDVVIGGFGIYGGRGEYSCKLKLFDLAVDGGGYEKEGVLVAETEEVPYECPARGKFNIMLPKPVNVPAGRWFMVWAKISGPSSDCGASGQGTVAGDDQVVFTFKSSKRANNGTDVSSGQIPSILYKVVNRDLQKPIQGHDSNSIQKVTKLFATAVSKDAFNSLITMCRWAFQAFKATAPKFMNEQMTTDLKMKAVSERMVYVARASLRLMRKYINEIYPTSFGRKDVEKDVGKSKSSTKPSKTTMGGGEDRFQYTNRKKPNSENIVLAECVGEVRALLVDILCDRLKMDESGGDASIEFNAMATSILHECHVTFVACFNAFFPTYTLKWNLLCDLLLKQSDGRLPSYLLSAVVAGLCAPNVNLRKTFSLLSPNRDNRSIVSPSDNSGLPMLSAVEGHVFPVLVEQMIYRTQLEKPEFSANMWTFKEVLTRLLKIVSQPIIEKIEALRCSAEKYAPIESGGGGKEVELSGLIENCCQLLRRVLGEIVYQSCLTEVDPNCSTMRSILSTGPRFIRIDNTKSWNTGNFGPDAISFSVDKPGIMIAGAMVYSGTGNYDYQLEILQDVSNMNYLSCLIIV